MAVRWLACLRNEDDFGLKRTLLNEAMHEDAFVDMLEPRNCKVSRINQMSWYELG